MMMAPIARDRTKTEHTASVIGTKYRSEDGSFCIVNLSGGLSAQGPADPERFLPGVLYRFMGRWKSSEKWGDSFHFDTFVIDSPAGETGVVAYLTTVCDGIGTKIAGKLWQRYGAAAVKVLRETPETVASDGILTSEAARDASRQLAEEKNYEATRIELFTLLRGKGFHGKLQNQAINRWGAKAPEIIRRDPFKLLGMAGAGFKRCDKLWLELGLPLDRLKRQLYASMEAIRNDRTGHTWLSAEQAAECCVASVGVNGARPKQALRLGIRSRRLAAKRDKDGSIWITLTNRADDERTISDSIRRLCSTGETSWPEEISIKPDEIAPSEHQLTELRKALLAPVGVFVGGPGVGKTFTLSFLLREIIATHGIDSVAVCAPTGKAAVRATQALRSLKLDLRATTIHQLLEIGKNGHAGGDWGFQRNQDNPLDQRFVIVDESSMIDTSLMAKLLDACAPGLYVPEQEERIVPPGEPVPAMCRRCNRILRDEQSKAIGYGPECRKHVDPSAYQPSRGIADRTGPIVVPYRAAISHPGTHILFIGDPFQLPPVGHGAPLRDLIAAGIPTGELTEVRRNAGRIVHACQAIKAGRPVEWSAKIDLEAGENLRLVECENGEILERIDQMLTTPNGIKGFHAVWQTQVIVGLNDKGACSRVEINRRLQNLLNPWGHTAPKCRFRVGDKIICLKNTWLKPCVSKSAYLSEQQLWDATNYRDLVSADLLTYVANGEIGRVVAVGADSCVVRFGESDTLLRVGTKAKSDEDKEASSGSSESDFDLAYAVTCHKLQGSESPCVIVVADDSATSVATREWWYTAISRASKVCIVVGPSAVVGKQVARVATVRRKTMLVETIEEGRAAAVVVKALMESITNG